MIAAATVLRAAGSSTRRSVRRPVDRSDAELIAACLAGKQSAWDELVERYARLVASVARKCGLGDADTDDVSQTVFLQMHRRLETLRDGERLSAWLITTASRESWRVARRCRSHADPEWLGEETEAHVEDGLVQAEQAQLVRQALRRLGGRDEQLLTALFYGHQPPNYQVIAQELGMKVGSIGPTRARAFKKLEKILVEMGFSGHDAADLAGPLPGKQAG